jgi:hypothetical protein
VERGFKTVAETRKLNPKDSNTNVLSCIWESKNYKVWPTGEFQRFGDKSLNRIRSSGHHLPALIYGLFCGNIKYFPP